VPAVPYCSSIANGHWKITINISIICTICMQQRNVAKTAHVNTYNNSSWSLKSVIITFFNDPWLNFFIFVLMCGNFCKCILMLSCNNFNFWHVQPAFYLKIKRLRLWQVPNRRKDLKYRDIKRSWSSMINNSKRDMSCVARKLLTYFGMPVKAVQHRNNYTNYSPSVW
jgi:hypothetical protein